MDGLRESACAHRPAPARSVTHSELFFKWIKPHLRINAFFGASENAVKTQIRIAASLLCARGQRPQAPGAATEPLPTSTDSERDALRETPILGALQALDVENDLGDSGNQLIPYDLQPDVSEMSQ